MNGDRGLANRAAPRAAALGVAVVVTLTSVVGRAAPAAAVDPKLAVVGPEPAVVGPGPAPAKTEHPRGHGMVVAGTVLTLGSVVAYGLMGAGLGVGNRAEQELVGSAGRDSIERRRSLLRRGPLGNRLAIVGAVAAAVTVAVGIPLIIFGRRRATAGSEAKAKARSRLVRVGVQGAGVFVGVRI